MERTTIRRILPMLKDFKAFWKKQGPFKYALTSAEFPPILLEPEEWIFSNDIVPLLKDLMQWEQRAMSIIKTSYNKNKKDTLKPEALIPWKIENFPKEWDVAVCETFTPVGYLTETILNRKFDCSNFANIHDSIDISDIEAAFFQSLEADINKIGYVLLKPEPLFGSQDFAYTSSYLQEWQDDEDGFI